MRIERIFGRVGHNRGITSELSVKRAMSKGINGGDLPMWIVGYEQASFEDDSTGVDGWVDTDVGRIKIQIKSSRKSAKEFRKNHPDTAVVIVEQGDEDEKIQGKIASAVGLLRKKYLRKRSNY